MKQLWKKINQHHFNIKEQHFLLVFGLFFLPLSHNLLDYA